jgi:hypothetical protein
MKPSKIGDLSSVSEDLKLVGSKVVYFISAVLEDSNLR